MKDGMHIIVQSHFEGECLDAQVTITEDQFKQIEKITGTDLYDDLTREHPIKIMLQTPEEHREAEINGLCYGNGISRKLASRIVDGYEPTDEDYDNDEADQEKEIQEIVKSTYIPHQLMQFFAYAHLPPHLQAVSKPYGELAEQMDKTLPLNPEKTTALRKLLESKDSAVRSTIFKAGLEQPKRPFIDPASEAAK